MFLCVFAPRTTCTPVARALKIWHATPKTGRKPSVTLYTAAGLILVKSMSTSAMFDVKAYEQNYPHKRRYTEIRRKNGSESGTYVYGKKQRGPVQTLFADR